MLKLRKLNPFILLTMTIALVEFTSLGKAWAVGGQRPVSPVPVEPSDRQAFPMRVLKLGKVSASSIKLPGNIAIDMNMNLREMVDSQVNQSRRFRTLQTEVPGRVGVFEASITSLELEIVQLKLKVGYRPGGVPIDPTNNTDLQLNGELTFNVGQIAMDFKIFDSDTSLTYGSVTTDSLTTGLNISFKVDFSNVSIGPEFQFRQALAPVIRGLVGKAAEKLESQSSVNMMPWSAVVREVDQSRKLVLFDAGVRSAVVAGDIFSVYRACQSSGCLERHVADIKLRRVYEGYSEAALKSGQNENFLNLISPGDRVYIYYMNGF